MLADYLMTGIFTPLSSVLNKNDSDRIVCFKEEVGITWQQFLDDISRLSRRLEKGQTTKRYLLFCNSSYQFTVGLFSIWQSGAVSVLPPNDSKEVLRKFEHYVDGFITDQTGRETELTRIDPIQKDECEYIDFKVLPENEVVLELFTSGTTGERKCVRKSIANLNCELQEQYNTFGTLLENTLAFSTVSHQHIYGLLHKILLPVCTNRAFIDETHFYPEKLIVDMSGAKSRSVLISGPAYLKLLPKLVDLTGMSNYCNGVFSSGSLLDTETSRTLKSLSGISPIEIFGSTETGGVAWRSQGDTVESKNWTPFGQVEVRKSEDNFLQVKSPFVYREDTLDGWFTMGDMVSVFEDNRFCLNGRGDRIVKIGEKRVSLEEMERVLKKFHSTDSFFVFPIIRKYAGHTRMILVCVVETVDTSENSNNRKIIHEFTKELMLHFDTVLIPKYWRFVNAIPRDQQGKISVEEIEKLFKKSSSGD